MRTGPWWVLVVLAAVFSMHGLQCMPADSSVTHTDTGSMSVSAMTAGGPTMDADAVPATAHVPLGGTLLAAQSIDHAPVGTGDSSHAWAHALAVCLAVLLAGLALLGGALLLRRVAPSGLTGAALARLRSAVHTLPVPRPPDLSTLCVLRI